jgi:hypothetical protein
MADRYQGDKVIVAIKFASAHLADRGAGPAERVIYRSFNDLLTTKYLTNTA